jgi:hypothetical protein
LSRIMGESDAFVHAMIEEDGREEGDVENRKKLFELAVKAHVANAQAGGSYETRPTCT